MGDYRPGIDALHGNGIRSPLLETHFTKKMVRNTAKSIGLSIYDKPSNSCLASRIPWGQRVTAEKLARIEMGEKIIKQKTGLTQVRVRDIDVIVDGTQNDDMGDYRPGIDALHGNGIRSPLLETHFTKNMVRSTAKSIGLSIHDKPSNSCLASRNPWGQRVTAEKLARIEMGEIIIKQKTGLTQVRVRDINGIARIEVEYDKINLLNDDSNKSEIFSKLKMIGFSEVEINPNGYVSGSLNVILEN